MQNIYQRIAVRQYWILLGDVTRLQTTLLRSSPNFIHLGCTCWRELANLSRQVWYRQHFDSIGQNDGNTVTDNHTFGSTDSAGWYRQTNGGLRFFISLYRRWRLVHFSRCLDSAESVKRLAAVPGNATTVKNFPRQSWSQPAAAGGTS